jgi:hypothetical protein
MLQKNIFSCILASVCTFKQLLPCIPEPLFVKPIVCSANQEIPRILWHLKVQYSVHKSPPPVHVLGHMNPVHIHEPDFPMTHFNIILLCTP